MSASTAKYGDVGGNGPEQRNANRRDMQRMTGSPSPIMRLGRIGFDHVAGYLKRGLEAIGPRNELIGKIPRVTAAATEELQDCAILDVRTAKEREGGHIEGSMIIPLNQLQDRIDEVPRDVDVRCSLPGWIPLLDRRQHPAAARFTPTCWTWSAATRPGLQSQLAGCPTGDGVNDAAPELMRRPR